MSMSTELTKMHTLAEEMTELLDVAAADEDVTLTVTTKREAGAQYALMWGLVIRLVAQGWSFSYDKADDFAREGDS